MSSLESIEKKQNIRFPEEYIKLYESDFRAIKKREIHIKNDIVIISKFLTAIEILTLLDEFYDFFGYDIIPIAETDYHDYICLYYTNASQNPAIIYWNYELALENPIGGISFLYSNIQEFVRKCNYSGQDCAELHSPYENVVVASKNPSP